MALFTVDNPQPPRPDWEFVQYENPQGRYPPSKERTPVVTIIVWTIAIMLLVEFAAIVGILFLMETMQ